MAIGPGKGTPNRIKNRLCVWSGMAVENMPIEVNIYVFIKSLTPKSRIIFKCSSYIKYSIIHSMQAVIPQTTQQLKGEESLNLPASSSLFQAYLNKLVKAEVEKKRAQDHPFCVAHCPWMHLLVFIDTWLWVITLPRIDALHGEKRILQFHLCQLFCLIIPDQIFSAIVWTHTLTSRWALPPISHPCSSLFHTTCLSIYTVESVSLWQDWVIRKTESSCLRNSSFHLLILPKK